MTFHPGDIVLTRDRCGNERAILLRGRNQCRRWMWWGQRIEDGHVVKDSCPLCTDDEIVATLNQDGKFQYILR